MMAMQEEKEKYSIRFEENDNQLPYWIHITFPSLAISFYIAEVNWPQLIEAIGDIESSLVVHEFQDYKIEAIRYDAKQRQFFIERSTLKSSLEIKEEDTQSGIEVGEWFFIPKKGFFPKKSIPFLSKTSFHKKKLGLSSISTL